MPWWPRSRNRSTKSRRKRLEPAWSSFPFLPFSQSFVICSTRSFLFFLFFLPFFFSSVTIRLRHAATWVWRVSAGLKLVLIRHTTSASLLAFHNPPPPLPLSPKLLSRLLYYLLFFHGSARYISTFPRLNVTTSSACFRFPASPLLSLSSGKQVTLERYVLCVYVRVYVCIYVRIYGRPSPSGWAPSSPSSSLSRIIRDKLRDIFRDRFRLTESKDSGTERDIWLESDEIVSNVLTRCTRVESRLFILD